MSRRIITAIDIGSSKVTTVIVAAEGEEGKPTVIGVNSPESKGIRKGTIVNIEEAADSILDSLTAAEKMAGITVSDVYVTINGSQISSINNKGVVAVSAGNEITYDDTLRAIENAKTLSLPQNISPIHIIPREFVVDNQGGIKYPLGMSGMRLEVETHIITAPMSSWQNITKCIRKLGLTVNDLVFTGWASSLAVLTDTEKELGVTMLDIGAGTTTVTIFQEGAIAYSGCVPIGGQNITSDIAIGLQVSLEDAEKIKLNTDKILSERTRNLSDDRPALLRQKEESEPKEESTKDLVDISSLGIEAKEKISKKMLQKIVEARLEEIFDIVRQDVDKAGFEADMPAGIVITGGSSQVQGITKNAKGSFGVPVRVGYPSGLTGMIEEISDPSFSAVQGLIKHAMDDEVESDGGGGASFDGLGNIFGNVAEWLKSLMP